MATTGTNVGLGYGWSDDENGWGDAVNRNFLLLDRLVQARVSGLYKAPPPDFPLANGSTFLVDPTPEGAWAGQGNKIATYDEGVWTFIAPREGWLVGMAKEWSSKPVWFFDGTVWAPLPTGAGGFGPYDLAVVGGITNAPQRTADYSSIQLRSAGQFLTIPNMAQFGQNATTVVLIKGRMAPPAADLDPANKYTSIHYPLLSVQDKIAVTTAAMASFSGPQRNPTFPAAVLNQVNPPDIPVVLSDGYRGDVGGKGFKPGLEWGSISIEQDLTADYDGLYRTRVLAHATRINPNTGKVELYNPGLGDATKKWHTPESGKFDFTKGIVLGAYLGTGTTPTTMPDPSGNIGTIRTAGMMDIQEIVILSYGVDGITQFWNDHSKIINGEIPPSSSPLCIGWWVADDVVGGAMANRMPTQADVTISGNPTIANNPAYMAWVVGPNPTGEWASSKNSLAVLEAGEWNFYPILPDQYFLDAQRGQLFYSKKSDNAALGHIEYQDGVPFRTPGGGAPYAMQGQGWARVPYKPVAATGDGLYCVGGTLSSPPEDDMLRYIDLNGSSQYLETVGVPDIDGPVTFLAEASLRSYSSTGDTDNRPVLVSSATNAQLRVSATSGTKRLTTYLEDQKATPTTLGGDNNVSSKDIPLNQKVNVAGVLDRVTWPYMDGVQGTSATGSGSFGTPDIKGPYRVGAYKARTDANFKRYWNGRVSRVAIVGSAMTKEQIDTFFSGSRETALQTASLVGYWEMDKQFLQDGKLKDHLTGEHNLEIKGGASLVVNSEFMYYLVGSNATGAWLGQEGKIAAKTPDGWDFYRITEGTQIYDAVSGTTYLAKTDSNGAMQLIAKDDSKKYAATFSVVGEVGPSQVLALAAVPYEVEFGQNFAGSVAVSAETPTKTSVYEVWAGGGKVADVTFSSGNKAGAITSTGYTAAAGDTITLYAPSSPDTAINAVSFTLVGERK